MRLKQFGILSLYSIAVIILFGLTFSLNAKAADPSSISVNLAPENPAPGENTTISLSSYSNNLDSVMITWFVNGANSASGIGMKSFSVNAPAAGSQSIVTAKIALPEGAIESRVVIQPSSMILLWQADDSYVPPFYKGKAMPTADTEIKIVAMPEVRGITPQNMVYAWQKNYTNDATASGYGKYYYVYTGDYLDDSDTVSVTASTLDGASSESNITVATVNPEISFYKYDTALGILWNQAMQEGDKIVGEQTVVAAPYFISPENLQNPSLVWSWFINNSQINVANSRKNFLPLKVQEGTSGTSTIRLQIDNKDRIFQTATKEMNVNF